jgi:hypothetical protein
MKQPLGCTRAREAHTRQDPCHHGNRVVTFDGPVELPTETNEGTECPLCLEHMQVEKRGGKTWLVCPNGCPTEAEVLLRKPPESESQNGMAESWSRAGRSSAR